MLTLEKGMTPDQIFDVRSRNVNSLMDQGKSHSAALSASLAHEAAERIRCGMMEDMAAKPHQDMMDALLALETASAALCKCMSGRSVPADITLADAKGIEGRMQKVSNDLWDARYNYFEPQTPG